MDLLGSSTGSKYRGNAAIHTSPPLLIAKKKKKKECLFLSLFLGNPIVLDFAVTHAQQLKYTDKVRNASWVTAGSFAEHYSSMEKGRQRREAVDAGCDFTAMVVESYGAWSPSASAVIRKVGERLSHASCGLLTEGEATSRIFTELNVTLMRLQARMMVTRLLPEDPLSPTEV